jgi:hypothetical protein
VHNGGGPPKRAAVLIIALGLVGIGAVLIHKLGESHPQVGSDFGGEQPRSDRIVLPEGADSLAAALAGNPADLDAASRAGKPDYRDQFKSSRDLWQFAETIYPAAMSGDPAAQYYLFWTLRYCFEFERFYFRRESGRKTLDEAMEWASTRPDTSAEEVLEIHGRCQRFLETAPAFGDREAWLRKSQDGGFELAILYAARRQAMAAGVQGRPGSDEPRKQARLLAIEALRSKDPEVIFGIGEVAHLISHDTESDPLQRWVWLLAACKRGHDCGSDAEWHRYYCHYDWNCQPSDTGADLVRRANPETFDEIDRLADALNAKLDAGNFDVFESAKIKP